jgi:hypothetical protein
MFKIEEKARQEASVQRVDEVTGGRRKLRKEELHNPRSPPSVIRVIR